MLKMAASKMWSVSETMVNGGLRFCLYASQRSRLKVAVCDAPGPMVHGCISFVTEANSDDGLPHTLEHLVFMGSNKYPFKGVLDIIANRCLASGTNAWTEQDHTAYTLDTIGSEGFLMVLPIYIDHLLSPMLSESQYATEVHHINGKGENAGVVYSEMQDYESEMDNIVDRTLKEQLFPPNHCYRVDTGGRLCNLRESCSLQKVRDYHKRYYHLSNMLVSVCGQVPHQKLLSIMEKVEEDYISRVPADFEPPFQVPVSQLDDFKEVQVTCPSDDASRGIVRMSWFTHEPNELETAEALAIFSEYFARTAVAPLQKDFVLLEEPLASSVDFHSIEEVKCQLSLIFNGVPVEKLKECSAKFMSKTVPEHVKEEGWDMERMHSIIEQEILNERVKLESRIHKSLFGDIISHQLYDNGQHQLLVKRLNKIDTLMELKQKPASYWAQLVRSFLTAPSATVIGIPNEKLVDEIAASEKKRLAEQKKALGTEGLKQKQADLEKAITENTSKKPDAELLNKLIVQKLEEFDRFKVKSVSNEGSVSLTTNEAIFLEQFPFYAMIHDCNTHFVEMSFLLDSSSLSVEQRAWLLLYTELLFDSPAVVEGKQLTAEEVAKLYTKDLIDHSVSVGVGGSFDNFVNIKLKVERSKLDNLSKWTEVLCQGVIFDPQRVKQVALRLIGDAKECKRDGNTVAHCFIISTLYKPNTNSSMYSTLVLEKFHEQLAELCDSKPNEVVEKLQTLRESLLKGGVNAHFVCRFEALDSKLFSPTKWTFLNGITGNHQGIEMPKIPSALDLIEETAIGRQRVVSVGGSESSFIYQRALIDFDWQDNDERALVPTLILVQYLSQCEGPLWVGIRGDGLAYGANIYLREDRKMIELSLYRCAQPAEAYNRTSQIVEELITSGRLDAAQFEAAKRSLVFELTREEGTVLSAATLAITQHFRELSAEYRRDLCARIWDATAEDVIQVGGQRVAKLFKPEHYTRVIAVHPSKVKEIQKAFPGIESVQLKSIQAKL